MQTGNPGGPGEGRELYDHSFRFGDCPQLHAAAYGRDCRCSGAFAAGMGTVWPGQSQGRAVRAAAAGKQAQRQADSGNRHDAHPGRGRKDHHLHRPDRRPAPPGTAGHGGLARAVSGAGVRREGRRHRRRPGAGGSHGGHQSAFYRGFPCHWGCQQSAGGHGG